MRLLRRLSIVATLLAVPACASKQKATTAKLPNAAGPATAAATADATSDDVDGAGGDGVLSLRPIYFAYDQAELDESARSLLADGATELKRRKRVRLRIAGHTDDRGTEEYNMALGDRRANAAKSYLVSLGVEAARIEVVSFGETRPAVPGTNEAAWARNRRAELEPAPR
jgi:peptidoglycan-associated lipoprotein